MKQLFPRGKRIRPTDKDLVFYTALASLLPVFLLVVLLFHIGQIAGTNWQGKTLSMKLVRAGRAMNAGVYFVTQNTDDLLDEKLKNNLGLKFAFRSTDINEIKKTLAFFGVDSEDENNQKRLRDLENGQCLISDLYGRVGVIQFHPIFEDLFHAFDTRPPVRKEVE